jgi:ABC-type cobalt transport system substrate-binding protein
MKIFDFILNLINPKSGKSSKRFIGLTAMAGLIIIALIALIPYTIPDSNASLLESISFTFGGIVIGVFIGAAIEKKKKDE